MYSGNERRTIVLQPGRKIYFSSDHHLGVPSPSESREREKSIVRWLEKIENDAQVIFLVGDIFDFWFEYGHVVPKGFVRLLGKLAELSDRGVELIFFTGNHDMWMFGYLTDELNARVYRMPVVFDIADPEGNLTTMLVGHGDGLGPGDFVYKVLKRIFANSFFQMLFRLVHPDVGMWIATNWSKNSRIANVKKGEERFMGEDKEWLLIFCREIEAKTHHDFYVFGHRHLPLDLTVAGNSRYINLGEWVTQGTYAVFDGKTMSLTEFIDSHFSR
jgi:UDP-2,3-diacylglucosamine hydrolase